MKPKKVQLSSLYGEFTPPFQMSDDFITKSIQVIDQYVHITEEEVRRRYSEPSRYFHTTEHLNDILSQIFDKYEGSEDLVPMVIAGIFHDIVYDPQRKDNEEKSVELLRYLSPPSTHEVWVKAEKIILATKTHDKIHELISDFNKFDCSILDRDYPELLKWEEQIYNEYKFAGWEEYKERRIQFLKLSIPEHKKNFENLNKLIEYIEHEYNNIG